jgi:hypothetical protein
MSVQVKGTRVEATAEVKKVGQGTKQVCWLHREHEQYPEKFEVWIDRDKPPYPPGFYMVDPNGVYLKAVERFSNGRTFRDQVLVVGSLLPAPLQAASPTRAAA